MNYLTVDLYRDFECIAGACSNSCCKGWNIDIDRETYIKMCDKEKELGIPAADWIQNHKGRITVRRDAEDRCPMLTKDGLCTVVLKLGPEYLSKACTQYPRGYASYGNVIEEYLYCTCPKVIAELMKKENVGFIMGEDMMPAEKYPHRELYLFEAEVRAEIVVLLQDAADISLGTRLFAAFTILEEAVCMYQNGQLDISSIRNAIEIYAKKDVLDALELQLKPILGKTDQRQLFSGLLNAIASCLNYKRFTKLVQQAIEYYKDRDFEQFLLDVAAFKEKCHLMFDRFYTNYWVYCIFSDTLSIPDYEKAKEKFLYIAVEFALFQSIGLASFVRNGRLDQEEYIYIISTLGRIMDHWDDFRENLMEKIHESNLVSAAGILVLTSI